MIEKARVLQGIWNLNREVSKNVLTLLDAIYSPEAEFKQQLDSDDDSGHRAIIIKQPSQTRNYSLGSY